MLDSMLSHLGAPIPARPKSRRTAHSLLSPQRISDRESDTKVINCAQSIGLDVGVFTNLNGTIFIMAQLAAQRRFAPSMQ